MGKKIRETRRRRAGRSFCASVVIGRGDTTRPWDHFKGVASPSRIVPFASSSILGFKSIKNGPKRKTSHHLETESVLLIENKRGSKRWAIEKGG